MTQIVIVWLISVEKYELSSVLPRNFITGDNVPGLLKQWGHLRKSGDIVGKMMGQ